MEREEIKTVLTSIEQEVSSVILGGMEESYVELERLGYIVIHADDAHPSATITAAGVAFLENN